CEPLTNNCTPLCRERVTTSAFPSPGARRVTMRARSTTVCRLLLAAVFFSTPLFAQSFQGSLRGVVKDAQGVIPGVSVTMVNEANNVTRDTVTNGVGEYSFPAVDPGNYTVKATVQGYKTFERKGVRIGTQESL